MRKRPASMILAALTVLGGCEHDEEPRAPVAESSSGPGVTTATRGQREPETESALELEPEAETEAVPIQLEPPSPPLQVGDSELSQEHVLDQLQRVEPRSFEPVGTTSTVFRTRLAAPFDAAYKSPSRARPLGPLAEAAAYRLARCLRLEVVPPVVSRPLPVDLLQARLHAGDRARWSELRPRLQVDERGYVQGVFIYWIPDLARVGLDRDEGGLSVSRAWLAIDGELPDDKRELAASASRMLGFDYLIGNLDRWSGGNVRGDPQATHLWVRDHDLAFPGRLSAPRHRRLLDSMLVAERISRGFYESARDLTRERFERELAADPLASRLSERQIAGVMDRRTTFVSHVEALIAEHGEGRVLVFE